ncbi:MAG TPA: hypothetical protein VD886_08225 [Herpetosiphonaceae bacterium]|nr:hypothetical protein [Herpetosiphonaceae bacterium]
MDLSVRQRARISLICIVALLLGACSPGAAPAPTPTGGPPAATSAARLRPTATPTIDPAPPTPEAGDIATPTPPTLAEADLPAVAGQTVLSLGRGAGDGNIGARATFRIGADGSIRVLDSENRRLIFYGQDGAFQRERSLAEANNPLDFIVAGSGDVFVLDYAGDTPDRLGPVLRYGADGTLQERIAVGEKVFGSALMLNSDNHLFVVNGVYSYVLIQHGGISVPAETQPFTIHRGAITPRSPVAFVSEYDAENNASSVSINGLTDVNGSYHVLSAPGPQHFFNVDRAMNVYTTSSLSDLSAGIAVRRYDPAGALLGGARIDVSGCEMGHEADRLFYVDQLGAAWTLCQTADGATVSRYDLLDAAGQPLPPAADKAAVTYWNPDPRFSPG